MSASPNRRKDNRTDAEIEADVDRMIADRKAADRERQAAYERSAFHFWIWLPVAGYTAALLIQVGIAVFAENNFVLALVGTVLQDLHLFSMLFLIPALYNAIKAKNLPKIAAHAYVSAVAVSTAFFLASPLETSLRNFLFADPVSVEAVITDSGYKGHGVGQRVKFEYEWKGKTYNDYRDFSNGYFFANEKRFRKGKFLRLQVSRRLPFLYRLDVD